MGRGLKDFNDNQEVLDGNRQGLDVEDNGEDQVVVPLRDQIPARLLSKLREMDIGTQVVNQWDGANANRSRQLDRQRKLLVELDEFMEPIYRKPQSWMSDLHLPTAFTICKTFHARMFEALMRQEPPFDVKARQSGNADRANVIQDLMWYTISRWANHNKGIEDAVDDFIWAWVTTGRGIWKLRWDREYTRFVDIVEETVPGSGQVIDGQFIPDTTTVERPVKKDEKIFDGPMWEHIPDEELVVVGGDGDPDAADFVCQSMYMTADKLWTLVDSKKFDKDAVEATIEGGANRPSAEPANNIKNDRAQHSGENSPDQQELIDRYQILEAYLKVDLDNSGICSDLVVWVHKETREILRATYLWRVMRTGMKPFAIADFYRRKGQESAVGLVELIYTLTKEIDAMHNMKIDFGLLSSLPIGFYRASSSMAKERIPLSPGNLIPLEDPSRDINFPVLGNRSAFAAGEEAALFNIISRATGISDLQLGILGAQGAARTATGTRAVVGESNANLDIFLRRLNRAFDKSLRYLFQMLTEKMPDGLEFRVTGEDGNNYFRQIQDRAELQGMYDFEVESNSIRSNRQTQIDNAAQIFQMTQNPILIQLGVVDSGNLFESAKNLLQQLGVKDWSRYINQPEGHTVSLTPGEIANRVLSGIDVRLDPRMDLQGFVEFAQALIDNDETLGQFSELEVIALAGKMQEAMQILQALQALQAQQANAAQIQQNAQLGNQQAPLGGVTPPPTPTEDQQ